MIQGGVRRTNAGLTLDQRRRRWSNVKPALFQRLVSAGKSRRDHGCRRHWNSRSVGFGAPRGRPDSEEQIPTVRLRDCTQTDALNMG